MSDIRLPYQRALKVVTSNLPSVRTCPGRSLWCSGCKRRGIPAHCYDAKDGSQANSYPSVAESRDANWRATEDLAEWVETMVSKLARKRPGQLIRIHSAGDFFSLDYFRAWLEVCERSPHLRFAAYTRTWRIAEFREVCWEAEDVANLCLWWSTDPTTGVPEDAPRRAFVHCPGVGKYHRHMPAPNCCKQTPEGKGAGCRGCSNSCWDKGTEDKTFIEH